jgi:hypothetical protein
MPIIKYDARAGRLFRVDRTQGAGGAYESATVEITAVFQAVMDLEHIELGWLNFPQNAGPEFSVVPFGQPIPAKPSLAHRPGFRINMLLGKQAGGDVREMASNADASVKGMDKLHDAYLAGVRSNPGKLPVVKLAGTEAKTSIGKQSSTNYIPLWQITDWVDRPAKLAPEAIEKLRTGDDKAGMNGGDHGGGHLPLTPPPPPTVASVADDF